MGPTSWLNHPVPLPDNLSSNEAKLRSCNYTQTFLLSGSPLAVNLSWWLFDSPFHLLPWSLCTSAHYGFFTKSVTIVFSLSPHIRTINTYRQGSLCFLLTDGFVSAHSRFYSQLFAITFAGKRSCALAITNISPFALCGLLRWVIMHQNIWPTNKQTNKHAMEKPWVIVLLNIGYGYPAHSANIWFYACFLCTWALIIE